MIHRTCVMAWGCLAVLSVKSAALTLPSWMGDHMVLQREQAFEVRGSASPNIPVTATFGDLTLSTVSDVHGAWRLAFPALPSETEGKNLTIQAEEQKTFASVRVGEVILMMGGHALMRQARLESDHTVLKDAPENAHIGVWVMEGGPKSEPTSHVGGTWKSAGKGGASTLPALAIAMAHRVVAQTHVPVGVVVAAVAYPEAALESWIDQGRLEKNPVAAPILEFYRAGGWNRKALESHEKQRARWLEERQRLPLEPAPEPDIPKAFDDSRLRPAGALYGLLYPLAHMPVRLVVFHHGDDEMSLMRAVQYGPLLADAMASWRDVLGQPELPVCVVELQPTRFGKYDDRCGAELRESQQSAGALPGVTTVTSIDLRPPIRMSEVAARVARVAIGHIESEHSSGSRPQLHTVEVRNHEVVLQFKGVGEGLQARGGPPAGFALAASRHRWVWADVSIDGDTITLSAPGLEKPQGVRYAYQDLPVKGANIYSSHGIPLPPFRTDDHPTYTRRDSLPDTVDRYATRKSMMIENPRLSRVLVIGDSISGGYLEPLRERLAHTANVIGESDSPTGEWHTFGPQCYTSTGALRNDRLKTFLASRDAFDIVTFNMGIHEFASASQEAPVDGYALRLALVVEVIRKAGAKPVWISSTGSRRDGILARHPHYLSNAIRFNEAAARVMQELNVPIVDLFALTQPNIETLLGQDNIHFAPEGYRLMADAIATHIAKEVSALPHSGFPRVP